MDDSIAKMSLFKKKAREWIINISEQTKNIDNDSGKDINLCILFFSCMQFRLQGLVFIEARIFQYI